MAPAAVFPFKYFFHRDRVGARPHQKDAGMTVPAVQPQRMRIMGINDIGQAADIHLENNVEIERLHRDRIRIQGVSWMNMIT